MPQSEAKSKAGKKGHRSSALAITPPAQDVKVEESSPRRSAPTPWTDTTIQEDTDEAVGEIMDGLMASVMEECLKVHYRRQRIPFTVSWAKSYLTKTLEHHFMYLETGEGPDELSRTEDSEPMPATVDSWAQGCIPVIKADHCSPHTSQQETNPDQVAMVPKVSQPLDVVTQTKDSSIQAKEEPNPRRLVREKQRTMQTFVPPQKTEGKQKQQARLPVRHDVGMSLPLLSCSTEQKAVKVKSKNVGKSVSDSWTGSLHQEKGCPPIPKLDPLQLPRNCIFPQYEIVDSSHRKPPSHDLGGLFRLSSRHKQQAKWMLPSLKPRNSSNDALGKLQRDACPKTSSPPNQRRHTELSEPVRLDKMTLAKGVSLLKHRAEEFKPLSLNRSPQATNMRLIRSDAAVPLFSVDEVISGPPPQVTLLPKPKPCNS